MPLPGTLLTYNWSTHYGTGEKALSQGKTAPHLSLAPDVLDYLESFRSLIQAPTLTAALEALVREQRRLRDEEQLARQVTGFYDSLTEEEREEERAWGKFAELESARAKQ